MKQNNLDDYKTNDIFIVGFDKHQLGMFGVFDPVTDKWTPGFYFLTVTKDKNDSNIYRSENKTFYRFSDSIFINLKDRGDYKKVDKLLISMKFLKTILPSNVKDNYPIPFSALKKEFELSFPDLYVAPNFTFYTANHKQELYFDKWNSLQILKRINGRQKLTDEEIYDSQINPDLNYAETRKEIFKIMKVN